MPLTRCSFSRRPEGASLLLPGYRDIHIAALKEHRISGIKTTDQLFVRKQQQDVALGSKAQGCASDPAAEQITGW